MVLSATNPPFPVSSLAPTEIDYVYSTAKVPLRPEEPKTEGGKGFHASILLFKKFLISIYYISWNLKVQAGVLDLQWNSFEEL